MYGLNMKKISIADLAYRLKQAKNNNQPQPIFFLGAGASKSGNIPLANEIAIQIQAEHPDNPDVRENIRTGNKDYASLMSCLLPYERNKLIAEYVENAKIGTVQKRRVLGTSRRV
jgi:hypothetical protein